MNYTKQVSRFFVLMLLIPLAGCIKSGDFDFKQIEWNPKLAIPLVSSNLTIMDMIKQTRDSSNLVIDNQGFVTLVYKNNLFSINPGSMIPIQPILFSNSHTFTQLEVTAINTFHTLTIPLQQDIKLTPADSIRIDSLIYGKGDLMLTITGIVSNNGSISFSIPEAKKNGIPLNYTLSPLANGSKIIDLSGYKFDLTKVAGKPSTFNLSAAITITDSPAGSITAGQVISFSFAQHTESIKVLSGYLGRFNLLFEAKTANLNIFNHALAQGQFSLVDPHLKFTFTNSIGLPVELMFSELRAMNTTNGQSVNLIGNPGLPNPIIPNSLAYTSSLPEVNTYTITNAGTGGALTNFFNIKPDSIIYNFYGLTNPGGEVSENFLRDTSELNVDVEVVLPLYGYIKGFAIQDTFNFKFDNIDEVESMLLRTIIDNEFPIEASMQVYFTDENNVRLDSLVTSVLPADQIIIPSAQVNLTTGELISAARKISDFSYSRERIDNILKVQKILVKAVLSTSGPATQNIKIYNTYKMKVKLAAQVEIKTKI